MQSFLFFAALALAACAPRAPEPAPAVGAATTTTASVPADTAPTRVTGKVRVVGSAPMSVQVVVVPDGGRSVPIEGPLTAEIRRLSGAEVEVWGRSTGRGLQATGYEVRAVDGTPVVMGVVERAPGGALQLRTAAGDVVQLAGAADRFQAGQKVWVQGPRTVQVQSYGVIRP